MGEMRKIILYITASLDGFIARKDGSVDWLENMSLPARITDIAIFCQVRYAVDGEKDV